MRYSLFFMTTPDTLFELDMDTGGRRVLKQTEVPGFDAANYRSEHLWIVARDGVKSWFRWSTIATFSQRTYAAGDGLWFLRRSIDADFSFSRLSLLDRGFVYAIVHVRGGGESGNNGTKTVNF